MLILAQLLRHCYRGTEGLGFESPVNQNGHIYPVHMSNFSEPTVLGSSFCIIINFVMS